MSIHPPPLLWAQRKDHILLTVDIQDCKYPNVKVEEDEEGKSVVFHFTGTKTSGEAFEAILSLFKEVEASKIQTATTARQILIRLPKKIEESWSKLVNGKNPKFVSVDWNRWVDSDEEGDADPNPGGFDPSSIDFSKMGSSFDPGADEEEEEDSDDHEGNEGDEEIPDLEPSAKESMGNNSKEKSKLNGV